MRLLSPSQLAVYLPLGALLTIATAWALILRSFPYEALADEAAIKWIRPAPPHWPQPLYLDESRAAGIRLRGQQALYRRADPATLAVYQTWILESGWPMLALSSFQQFETSGPTGSTTEHSTGVARGIPIGAWRSEAARGSILSFGYLPVAILPLGFLINTLFYTAITGGAHTAFVAVRRRRRSRRGHCPTCNYDLATLPTCPECGTPRARSTLTHTASTTPPPRPPSQTDTTSPRPPASRIPGCMAACPTAAAARSGMGIRPRTG
jgi:hypothetical protein